MRRITAKGDDTVELVRILHDATDIARNVPLDV
jgi:hypothetical protein